MNVKLPCTPAALELRDRRKNLLAELVELERGIARSEGYTILPRDDPTYRPLHSDLSLEVIAEGVVIGGNPETYYFYYDTHEPSHVAHIELSQPTRPETTELADMSDSDSDSDHSDFGVDTIADVKRQQVAITREQLRYKTLDISTSITLSQHAVKRRNGGKWAFFVIKPEEA